jgi:signal transduction histidine kinase/DNA-binding LacI/PurR family transcriptional regulator
MIVSRKSGGRPPDARPTIGLLLQTLDASFWKWPWLGVVDAARARGANVICFAGEVPESPGFERQHNILFKLVDAERVDALVVWSAVLDAIIGAEGIKRFCQQYHPIPIVTVERTIEGFASLLMDDYQGVYAAMTHLIEQHGYRRIAFISGAKNHAGAQERYRAYAEALAHHDLPLDPNLVTPPTSHWNDLEGRAVITHWLDERKPDLEALMGVNDSYTLFALEILAARGIRVPDDVAVVGFDDYPESASLSVPLTTVRPPFYKLGWQATEMALALAAGAPVAAQTSLPTELIIRQSCGCLASPAILSVTGSTDAIPHSAATRANAPADQPGLTLAELARVVQENNLGIAAESAKQILDALLTDVAGETNGRLLLTLNRLLRQTSASGISVAWYHLLSTLRRQLLAQLAEPRLARRAEDLWQQAQILVGEAGRRAEMRQAWQEQQRAAAFRRLGQALITSFDLAKLMDVIAHELPQLGIRRCYLSLYTNPQAPAEQARLILAYDEHGRVALPPGGRVFPSRDLLPGELWHPDRSHNLVIEALFFQEQQLGFVLFEADSRESWIYETLRGQLSSSLKGALLVEQEERRARQLQTVAEVGALVSTILDTDELLQSIVDLTNARFKLYHTQVYLLDARGDTLILAAGAGTVGRDLVAQGWHIPLHAEQSLVARAARSRQSVVVNDVQADPTWLPNPRLPETHAELALPLLAGDQVLGVLDVQSDAINYFTPIDVPIQSTFARQITAALQNARLYQELEQQTSAAKQARTAAEQANTFKSQFLSTMSHELRTPLNAIRNFSRFLNKESYGSLTTRQTDLQQRILANADHLLALLNDILDLSKIEAGRMDLFMEPTALRPILQGVLATIGSLVKDKGLSLTLEAAEDLPLVRIDKTRIRQVLLNLLANAVKFTKQGGISVRAAPTDDGMMVCIRVTDSGIGIAPAHQALVFEEFRQVQDAQHAQQGTGLGLPISKRLVELHGGRLWLESQPGEGSTFAFTVPISPAAAVMVQV